MRRRIWPKMPLAAAGAAAYLIVDAFGTGFIVFPLILSMVFFLALILFCAFLPGHWRSSSEIDQEKLATFSVSFCWAS